MIRVRFVVAVLGIACSCLLTAGAFAAEKPEIVKRGTIDCDLVESTPIVFGGKLYRFEYVRERYKPNTTGGPYFRFIDVATGEATPAFAKGYALGCAYAEGGYDVGVRYEGLGYAGRVWLLVEGFEALAVGRRRWRRPTGDCSIPASARTTKGM